ncbi:sporulation inhibitor of replication protein SirA [Guptibacillus algicola]|uniref:sporulation inhibitor of replication protein SirA n=1 Tax=Guptibacillus algicola TaxID=225844 RepID=UPI001CD79B79|nr:sporulation inhibitor of replication protein SirA [Alkalihalobacillus algicola]MCA0988144.1 sporulation inhibitor of replication protein SirA [Alkalihalobacillus algicola]
MRHYEMHLIKQEVAVQYGGKELLLYQLFNERKISIQKEEQELLDKQIDFITESIPVIDVNRYLVTELGGFRHYEYRNGGHCLTVLQSKSDGSLFVNQAKINIYSNGTYEAETIFFEVLRKLTPTFFAIDYQSNRFGWLSPLKKQKLV